MRSQCARATSSGSKWWGLPPVSEFSVRTTGMTAVALVSSVPLDVAGSSSLSAWIARSRPFNHLHRGQAARPALKDEGLFAGHAADGRQKPHWPVAHGTEELVVAQVQQPRRRATEASNELPLPHS
jgi:hypothetical protein